MRTISYRGLNENKEWKKGSLIIDDEERFICNRVNDQWKFCKIDPDTIGQFVGNFRGIAVYEGDIICLTDTYNNDEYVGCATVTPYGYRLIDKYGLPVITEVYDFGDFYDNYAPNLEEMLTYNDHNFRVMGNIHENRDLLYENESKKQLAQKQVKTSS